MDISISHQDCPEYFKQTVFVLPVPWCCCVLQALHVTQVPQKPAAWLRSRNITSRLEMSAELDQLSSQGYKDCT